MKVAGRAFSLAVERKFTDEAAAAHDRAKSPSPQIKITCLALPCAASNRAWPSRSWNAQVPTSDDLKGARQC